MNIQRLLPLFILACGFVIGLRLGVTSLDGKATVRLYQLGRVVAGSNQTVKKPLLLDERLTRVENIIESLTVVRSEELGVIGIQFGNYIPEYYQSLCSAYSKIEIVLFGDEIATSGDAPKMIISGLCPSDPNAKILTHKLPQIFPLFLISDCKSSARIQDQIELSNGTNIKTVNMFDIGVDEPKWLIQKINFIDESNPVNTIEFNHQEIKTILVNKSPNAIRDKIFVSCN